MLMKSLEQGLRFHTHFIKNALFPTIFISNQLIDIYSKNGLLQEARYLFDEMSQRNVFTWNAIIHGYIKNNDITKARLLFDSAPDKDSVTYNSMISGYVRTGHECKALELFAEMQDNAIPIDEFTLTTMLNLTAQLSVLPYGKQLHTYVVKTANDCHCFGISSLIDMYSKCRCFADAHRAFEGAVEKDSVSKNAMVAACCREGELDMAFDLFWGDPAVNDTVSWNTLISGCAQNSYGDAALALFVQMGKNSIRPNEHTFASVLSACSSLKSLKHGKEIHACVLKNGLSSNQFISSSIVDVYCKCDDLQYAVSVHAAALTENAFSTASMIVAHSSRGKMVEARRLFDSLGEKNSVVWTALFSGYVRHGQCDAVYDLFREFERRETGVPDPLILVHVLGACSIQAALNHGKEIHAYMVRMGMETEEKLVSTMVDMYAKCGAIKYSEEIFQHTNERDRVLYNAMLAGFAHHGREKEVIQLYEEMVERDIIPDAVTFIALLSACRHAGLVKAGEKYFHSMTKDHGITPEIDHYSCMVDLLGRAGHLDKALLLIRRMAVEPDAIIWGTFLNACRMNGNVDLARKAEDGLLRMEADNGARYVQLANVYAAQGEWSEMGRIRRKMRGREAKKIAGCSWVYVENEMNAFTSGDRSHSKAEAIYAMLASLSAEMRGGDMAKQKYTD
ncbi:putative pentatricopeptide repeat-containing protein At3g18840 [Magnolia sinica]|uniref:putative pentatricopeptide repeat-containing protein At3g18840 n=1 Tax=Magnolia sinica TaxID=86752 RepID=UPI00265A1027|nr:putative pentatricopeptide repeat-containing protein At3g18840 [Magnolia sinica]